MDDDTTADHTLHDLETRFCSEVAQSPHGKATPQTLFNYGWALTKSPVRDDVHKGIRLLEELLLVAPHYHREALFFLAEAHYVVGNYAHARRYISQLIAIEPFNSQARELDAKITKALESDGLIGLAIVGTVAAAAAATAGVVLAALLTKRR